MDFLPCKFEMAKKNGKNSDKSSPPRQNTVVIRRNSRIPQITVIDNYVGPQSMEKYNNEGPQSTVTDNHEESESTEKVYDREYAFLTHSVWKALGQPFENLPDKWKFHERINLVGFSMVVFVNEAKKAVVVVCDSRMPNGNSILNDLKFLTLLGLNGFDASCAISLVDSSIIKSNFQGFKMSFTGHSAGAAIAEYIAWYSSNVVECVTFESPGSVTDTVVRQMEPRNQSLRITTYLTAPNLINTFDGQLALCLEKRHVYRIKPPRLRRVSIFFLLECCWEGTVRLALYLALVQLIFSVMEYSNSTIEQLEWLPFEMALFAQSAFKLDYLTLIFPLGNLSKVKVAIYISFCVAFLFVPAVVLERLVNTFEFDHGMDSIVKCFEKEGETPGIIVNSWPTGMFGSHWKKGGLTYWLVRILNFVLDIFLRVLPFKNAGLITLCLGQKDQVREYQVERSYWF